MTYKKNELTYDDIKTAIDITEGDIEEIAELIGKSTRTAYREINKFNLKEYYLEVKNSGSGFIGELAKDVTFLALLNMKNKFDMELIENKCPVEGLNKQEVILLIFLLKSQAGFIEQKTEKESDDDDEQIVTFKVPDNSRYKE